MSMNLPSRANVVIIGGGVIGCSIAYHLAKTGITDVLLLERMQLTCGTTWHAAGLMAQLRANRSLTELNKYTTDLLFELERETGQATGFRQSGTVAVATNRDRMEELARGASMGRNFGLEAHVVTPSEIKSLYPLINVDDLVGGVFLPKDGQANPIDVTQAYAKGARQRGARIVEGVKVEKILVENGRAVGVDTTHGEVRSATVVLAGGMWSHRLAKAVGVSLPLHAAEHVYIVTEHIADLPKNLPVLRVQDECAYYKEDAGKILLGAFEPVAKPWGMAGISESFCFDQLPFDFEHFEPILDMATRRFPKLAETGVKTFFNGPESFTHDGKYLLGETSEVDDLFVACGLNSMGIQSSGGIGRVMADWIRDRRPPMDLADVDVRRTHAFQSTRQYLYQRTTESLGLMHAMHWPYRQYATGRGARRSPFHDRLVAAGACMGELTGWERPHWFAPPGVKPEYEYSYGRQNWFAHVAAECAAVQNNVALFDLSFYTKILVSGRDATTVLNQIAANQVDVPVGRIVYTQWLNEKGGIEADLTITRLAENEHLVVTAAASQTREFAWLRRHIPGGARCIAVDVTSGLATLGIMGPRSRELLQELTGEDLTNSHFPFGTSREVEIGYALVRASRITYVGELGWELYIPTEFAVDVFDRIVDAGRKYGLAFAGAQATNSCRTEKGYRHWGHDIADTDTALEAGLGFAVAWDKEGGFIGRDALVRQREKAPLTRQLVQVRLADESRLLYHEEPIWLDGRIAGSITSGAFGHRVGASLGMGYVRMAEGVTSQALAAARAEVEIAGERIPIVLQLPAFYDPKGARVKT
jgi:glycine cleavage system aminomethyltransferase T/glycine/D-amino acid oxidase-like deaminating enzyme